MPEDYFGEDVAARYDDDADIFDPAVVDPVVEFLADLAGDGAALELGIGTGRIAPPLAQRGVRVHGIEQGLVSHHYAVVDGELRVSSIPFRYVWPSELDLMARFAGMTPRERWSGWKYEPFTSESAKHVSVWEKTASR